MKNITFGQYIFGDSFLHRANPKTKLFITFFYIFIIFFFNRISVYIFGIITVMALYKVCSIPLKFAINNFRSVFFLLVVTSIINLFFGKKGEVIFKFLFMTITKESLMFTILILLRLFLLMVGVSILSYTTLPLDIARSLGDLFLPLKRFNFPVGEISTMLSISIKFVPVLVSEAEKIKIAQRSRGADTAGKSLKKKIKFIVSILVPLLISSFKRADELAVAMESRCYCVGKERTRYITFSFGKNDLILLFTSSIFFICLFVINSFSFLI